MGLIDIYLKVFVIFMVLIVVVFVLLSFLLKYLTSKMRYDGENFEPEETIGMMSVPSLVLNMIIKPRLTVETGAIANYDEEQYNVWLACVFGFCGFVFPIVKSGLSGFVVGVITFVFAILLGFWSCWFNVALKCVLYRYVAGINLDYDEGTDVFKIIFLAQYVLSAVATLINLLTQRFFYGATLIYDIVAIAAWIWGIVAEYKLLKYRYRLSGKESLLKMLLMFLVQCGFCVVLGIVLCVVMVPLIM